MLLPWFIILAYHIDVCVCALMFFQSQRDSFRSTMSGWEETARASGHSRLRPLLVTGNMASLILWYPSCVRRRLFWLIYQLTGGHVPKNHEAPWFASETTRFVNFKNAELRNPVVSSCRTKSFPHHTTTSLSSPCIYKCSHILNIQVTYYDMIYGT